MSTQFFRDQFLAKFGTLVLYTSTGKELISGIGSNVVVCRADGTRIGEFREHKDDVFSVAVTQAGLALSGDRDGTIRLWRIADRKQIAAGQPGGLVWAVAVSRDASLFASCSGGAPIIWRLEKPSGLFARSSLRPLTTLDSPVFGPLAPRALAFSPSGNYLN
jgi:WD40 repeat protein